MHFGLASNRLDLERHSAQHLASGQGVPSNPPRSNFACSMVAVQAGAQEEHTNLRLPVYILHYIRGHSNAA